jgi:prefoldin subunit 5
MAGDPYNSAEGRAPHNPRQQLIRAGEQGQSATELVAAAGSNVPALVAAVGTIAERFEQFVGNIAALNQALGEFREQIAIPLREDIARLRLDLGERVNHATTDLEKRIAALDHVIAVALQAAGMKAEQIERYREEHGLLNAPQLAELTQKAGYDANGSPTEEP